MKNQATRMMITKTRMERLGTPSKTMSLKRIQLIRTKEKLAQPNFRTNQILAVMRTFL